MSQGHHNQNFLVTLDSPMARLVGRAPGARVMVRQRVPDTLPVVVRTWQDESRILAAIQGVLPHVPECLAKVGDTAVHSYVEGVPLSSICRNGKPVDTRLITALTGLLAQMMVLRRENLPRLPGHWPRDGHSRSFLRTLANLTDEQVRQPNWAEFGGLFAALGVPDDAMSAFAGRLPPMAPRPFSLLHTDLHRDNVIVSFRGDWPLICVDWELASYGDPLHDLATHLVRMQYPDFQKDEVKEAWCRAIQVTRPDAVNGMESDLRHYVDFERAQSVYPDVMRAARSLGDDAEPVDLPRAGEAVIQALTAAQGPLRLRGIPGPGEVERILYRWHAARTGRSSRVRHPAAGLRWVPDVRVPEHPNFPAAAVAEALDAEGAATAAQVFKGTGHLNTVVRVESIRATVVVRRKVREVSRREPCFLDEHAVLQALEGLRGVRVPKILALGVSEPTDQFAVHSYEGPVDSSRPPDHPVQGLLPDEADDLVGQLVALVEVDTRALDPTMGSTVFYQWLSDRLVELVDRLPKESLQLAGALGLPPARRLKEILARHEVTPRKPVLLHGDLNPWNLVRGAEGGQLTIIDWEMAMVGDPLYDLVRHLHLTPNRAEIRQRMLQRWHRRLAAHGQDYVRGWEQDVHIYRWIEIVRSAYVDLDRLVTGESLDAPNVRRAVDSYAMTLSAATASLGLRSRPAANPYLVLALAEGDYMYSRSRALSFMQ
ncbi:aminoglycoside phosphotransferase family protein [Streptomyces sp. NPDC050738]|uniref:phosphotransferase family protein n=1 Tax=Streptomyces sp. NPDC050738 TaxID=3154744 RepID=UPI0034234EAF